MQSVGQGTELQLKVAVKETDLLALLRSEAHPGRHSKNTRLIRADRTTEVVANFSPVDDSVTLTAKLHPSFPLRFVLRPETKTYGNFVRFLAKELRTMTSAPLDDEALGDEERIQVEKTNRLISELTAYLESKLNRVGSYGDSKPKEAAQGLTDFIDIFGSDFEFCRDRKGRVQSFRESAVGRDLLRRRADRPQTVANLIRSERRKARRFRLFDRTETVEPALVSSFLGLEIQEMSLAQPPESKVDARSLLKFTSAPTASVNGRSAQINVTFSLPFALLAQTEFFVRWGSYQHDILGWLDEEISLGEIKANPDYTFTINKTVTVPGPGDYGATFYALIKGSDERIWCGRSEVDDARFTVTQSCAALSPISRRRVIEQVDLQASILRSLSSYDRFVRTLASLGSHREGRGLGKVLADLARNTPDLRNLISEYYQRLLYEYTHENGTKPRAKSKARMRTVLNTLQNIGIGEIVLVAPEGPHAISGGLAQAVVGLMTSISRSGIPVTLITPIYEESQGNKHKDAESLIHEGLRIGGETVPIEQVGSIKVSFGPTWVSGTTTVKQPAQIITAQVYRAELGLCRVFFLRHPWLANKIYPSTGSDDQIRRGIFLSRGAIELLRDPNFDINAHILITNDWLTGLIPGLLSCDPTYRSDPRLEDISTVHILHNCGRDYQGRHLVNQFGEDLWPLIGLSGEHYFGYADPIDQNLINLTAAAVFHVKSGLLAVSKPYAQQLLTPEGGEGLDRLFRARKDLIFGISNGVDLRALRRIFWQLGENARATLNLSPLLAHRYNDRSFLKRLTSYKQATKALVQKKYGLKVSANAVLVSFVGRLTEQKGIQLFSQTYAPEEVSVLEAVLRRYPEVQIIIGGPASDGDPVVDSLRVLVDDLSTKYPNRIRGLFSFILHQDALEITKASDFFLMPSRYEPGGITQLEALAAGTLVIARNVGGIAATLQNYDSSTGRGNAFLFERFTGDALADAIFRALSVVHEEVRRRKLLEEAALAENDWGHRAPKYLALFQHIAGVLAPTIFTHLSAKSEILSSIRAG